MLVHPKALLLPLLPRLERLGVLSAIERLIALERQNRTVEIEKCPTRQDDCNRCFRLDRAIWASACAAAQSCRDAFAQTTVRANGLQDVHTSGYCVTLGRGYRRQRLLSSFHVA